MQADGAEADDGGAADEDLTPLLVFRAGSQQPKAVLLSLVSRLEEIDCRQIEISDGRHLLQYRDQLMPLLRIDTQTAIKQEGAQPILVFSDHGRSMGLLVDEIVDIVEQRLDIEVASEQTGSPRLRGGKGQRHRDCRHWPFPSAGVRRLVPLARWAIDRRRARRVLLVDDSAFFRDLLAPLIKAAGYHVTAVASAARALDAIKSGPPIDIVVTDIEMPEMDGFEFVAALRENPATSAVPVIALSAMVSTDAIQRGRRVGFHDFVAKFDRAGLIAAIKEQSDDLHQAA